MNASFEFTDRELTVPDTPVEMTAIGISATVHTGLIQETANVLNSTILLNLDFLVGFGRIS